MKVVLDLSTLASPAISRGVGRHISTLALGLHEQARTAGDLSLLALTEVPLVGTPRVSADIPAVVEELTQRTERKVGSVVQNLLRRSPGAEVEAFAPDIFHSPDPGGLSVPAYPARSIVTCHHLDSSADPSEWHGAGGEVAGSVARRFRSADRVIATSRATAQDLITQLNIPRQRIRVVHNGVDPYAWTAEARGGDPSLCAALGVGRTPYLLGVGGVEERKNVDGIFEGLARARKLVDHGDLRIVWAGQLSRAEEKRLSALARDAGVEGALKLVGHVSDMELATLYRGATALVFVSRREGFGYPVVEAMACGTPVITSNTTSLVEVAHEAAITVSPEDPSAIADAIVSLADDNAGRRELAAAGVQRAREFSRDAMVRGTLEAYEEALSGGAKPAAKS